MNFKILSPLLNGLSDHDTHRIRINDINLKTQTSKPKNIRKISKYTAIDFIIKLSYETWDSIFDNIDVNTMSNSSRNIYCRILYSSLTLKTNKNVSSSAPTGLTAMLA